MTDSPTAVELLDAVVLFLREQVKPPLEAAGARDARIAASLLQMVRRELARPAGDETEEIARLQSLLDSPAHDVATLNRLLCERIADGGIDATNPALTAHLWAVTAAKLAIDQPAQSTYVRVFKR